MSKRSKADESDPAIRELSDIKKLLILDLMTRGVKPMQIARILDIDKGQFSRMYPMREIIGKSKNSE